MENKDDNPIEYDQCVMCGQQTPYPKNMDIDQRHCYIEGAGQLCVDCCKKMHDKK